MPTLYEQNETLKEIYNKMILPQSATNIQSGVFFFYLSKNAKINALNIYIKIIIFIFILLYPIYASVILQIIVFIVKYIYSFLAGIPYASTPRKIKAPTVQTMYDNPAI